MPYVLAHTLFGYKALQQAGEDPEASPAFYLGCLGPDPYFANRWVPKGMRKLSFDGAGFLHSLPGDRLFQAMLPATDAVELDFLKGMYCHFCLDAAVHPYILSRSSGIDHTHLEVEIDMQLYKDYAALTHKPGQRQWRAPLDRLDLYMERAMQRLGAGDSTGVYRRSARLFLIAQRLSFDPTGRKRALLEGMERITGKKRSLSGFMTTVNLADRRDAMNRSHSPWRDPHRPETVHTADFMTLFQEGQQQAVTGLQLILQRDWQGLSEHSAPYCMEYGHTHP